MTAVARTARRTRVRVPKAAVAALVLLVIGTSTLAPAVSRSLEQQRQIADAAARVAAQEKDLEDLRAQRARWDDPAYVRAQAGTRLFYVLPGTTAYRVLHGTAGRGPAPAPTAQPERLPWTGVLVDSLIDAGTTTSTPKQLGALP